MAGVQAEAGNLTFSGDTARQEIEVDEAPIGGSSAADWVIPLVAIAVIGLAISARDDDEPATSTKPDPCGKTDRCY